MTSRRSVHPVPSVGENSPATPRRLLARLAPSRAVEVVGPSGIVTPRMVLRPLREADRGAFLRAVGASRAHLERWVPLHNAEETDDEYFDRQWSLAETGDRQGGSWRRVGVLSDGRIVGGFNLNAIARGLQSSADANWWISSEFVRQGYGREGLDAMLRHAFADLPGGLGLHTVHAGIAPGNEASIRLAATMGFRHDPGVQSYLRIGDRWELHDIYAITVLDAHALAG